MNLTFFSLIRLVVFLSLVSVLAAIGVSKFDPPRPAWRTRIATKYYNINEYFMNFSGRTPHWIDAETGRVAAHSLEDGDVLEAASSAPWIDERGQHQVAGRWSRRTKSGPMSVSTDFGLARYAFPSGQMLDHVSTEIVPVGPPSWYPGVRARILFTGGDGQLYQYAFEPDPSLKPDDPEARRDDTPTPLLWRCPKPGSGNIFMSDLTWPEDPRMIGYVVVSLREQTLDSEVFRSFTRSTLWWLKLDFEGISILEAGRFLHSASLVDQKQSLDQRSPTLGTLPDGRLVVAYLAEKLHKAGWDLRLAPVEFEADHNIPRAIENNSVLVSPNCLPAHPSFSADSRWLNVVAESSAMDGQMRRIPLGGFFPKVR